MDKAEDNQSSGLVLRSMIELIHFREVAFDLFGLLNKDNDRYLRAFNLDPNGEFDNEGELKELFQLLKEDRSLQKSSEKQAWIASGE